MQPQDYDDELCDLEAPLPVADAAARLGVSERRLRRFLQRPEYAARTVAQTRRTRTGTRTGAALPPALLHDLAAAIEHENNAANGGAENTAQTQSEGGGREQEGGANTDGAGFNAEGRGEQLVRLYQRVIEEKDARLHGNEARLRDKDDEIEYLRAALRLEQESRRREQTLRALAAPVPDVSAQAPDSPQANESGEVAAEAGQGENVVTGDNVSEQSRRRSWWPWRRKES